VKFQKKEEFVGGSLNSKTEPATNYRQKRMDLNDINIAEQNINNNQVPNYLLISTHLAVNKFSF